MKIIEPYNGFSDVDYIFEYEEMDSFDHLDYSLVKQTYAVCFIEETEKVMIVHNGKKKTWGLIGGTVEPGETLEQTLRRELQEEGNVEVLDFCSLGCQKVIDTRDDSHIFQLRYVVHARPYGEFESDPDESIDKVDLIDPKKHKEYFDWGKIGERIFERAIEIKKDLNW